MCRRTILTVERRAQARPVFAEQCAVIFSQRRTENNKIKSVNTFFFYFQIRLLIF